MPQRRKRPLVDPGVTKEGEKARERRLTGDLPDREQLGQHRIGTQPGNLAEALRSTENADQKTQSDLLRGLRRPATRPTPGGRTPHW